MKCPFCAEEIQDAAILCRFCGARIIDGRWQPPAVPAPHVATPPPPAREKLPGAFTIRLSGALMAISALLELTSIVSPVPLFGAMRGGLVAALYHGIYLIGFVTVGYGLWKGTRWGLRSVLALTCWYTLDKVVYLIDTTAREAEFANATSSEIARQVAGMTGQGGMLDGMKGQIFQLYNITILVMLACWWSFALFVYLRRAYFEPR